MPGRPAPVPNLRGPATRSKPPASLSQDFRRHIAAPPEVPQRAPYDLWHVAIQDVPVGPMTRDELGRKIDAGAVTADSLCWREGMDDWRPLGELPELAQLLRRPRPEARSLRPPRPRVPPPVVPAPPRAVSFPPHELEEIEDDSAEPTRIADMTGGLPAMPPVATSSQVPASNTSPRNVAPPPSPVMAQASQPLIPQEGSVAMPMPRRERMSGSTGLALGLLVGILIVGGPMLYRTFWVSSPPQPTAQAAPPPVEEPKTKITSIDPQELAVDPPDTAKPEEGTSEDTKPRAAGNNNKVAKTTSQPAKTQPKDNLTEEQRKLLARMGGAGADPTIGAKAERETRSSGPSLTAAQLTSVVQSNKVQLQRCYESALRAAGGKQDGAIKVTVAVTVGESGLVKSVTTKGQGLGNMNECMKSSVKRWRFPASGGESEFEFPLVFQPGA